MEQLQLQLKMMASAARQQCHRTAVSPGSTILIVVVIVVVVFAALVCFSSVRI